MDVNRVHDAMKTAEEVKANGGRLGPNDRKLVELIRDSKLVDRMDADVLVVAATQDGDPFLWEHYEGIVDYEVSAVGGLSIRIGGTDADGDWLANKIILYPSGRWLKVDLGLTSIPNPYWRDPDLPDPSDAPPAGFDA